MHKSVKSLFREHHHPYTNLTNLIQGSSSGMHKAVFLFLRSIFFPYPWWCLAPTQPPTQESQDTSHHPEARDEEWARHWVSITGKNAARSKKECTSPATVADQEAKILHDFFGFLEHPARFLQDWWHWSAQKDFLPSVLLPEILLSPTRASAFASQNQAYRQREVWKKLSLLQKSPSPMTRRELKSSEVSRTAPSYLLAAAIRDLETKARDWELREKWVLDFGLQ